MSTAPDLLLTKGGEREGPRRRRDGSTPGLPISMLRQASKRLQVVCILLIVLLGFGWLGGNWLEGELGDEFRDPFQWGPGVTMILASAVTLLLARSSRLSPLAVVRVALAYQVAISFCIPISEYYHAFQGVDARYLSSDLVGLCSVAIWMLVFAGLVPARPRDALLALSLSGSSVPITMALLIRFGDAPAVSQEQFAFIFVLPYATIVAVAYIVARIIYGLGKDIRRAQEMGSYRLEELIGRGGMGEVWRASHNLLARPAAIKLIRSAALGLEPGGASAVLTRFEREAQATASLQSPHTVELYDFGVSEDGAFYYVMELLDGTDLESLVERYGPLPAARVVHILRQACRSLGEAHRRGLVHRDIKPANLYLCRRAFEADFVKILDFGLVRHSDVQRGREPAVTRQGLLAGTPSYMAPEMAEGKEEIDGRADIYALACVAFKLLTGRRVFEEDTVVATIVAHVQTAPQPPSAVTEMEIPPELDRLVLQCLSKDPAHRPGTAEDLAAALDRIPIAEPWTRRQADDWWRTHFPEAAPGVPPAISRLAEPA